MPNAEIVTIGDELLSGETVDTNSNYLDRELERMGWRVRRHTTVDDDVETIASAFREAAARSELVLSSGGLGPTEDDLTLEALARALDCPLRLDEPTLERIADRFRSRGFEMTPNNRRQAMVPEIGEVIENDVGSAPAFTAELGHARIFLMPGVPREVHWLMENVIGPRIDRGAPLVERRLLRVVGIGESRLEHTIREVVGRYRDRVRVGFRTLGAENQIKLVAPTDGSADLDEIETELRGILGDRALESDNGDLMNAVGESLKEKGQTVATAESCTGGLIGKLLTDAPGSSAYFLGGFVTYSNRAKVDLLGVSESDLIEHGAVSEPIAAQMATGARNRLHADWGLSATGIAGPDGGTDEKPVGTIYVGMAGPDGTVVRRLNLFRDRRLNRRDTATLLLDMLRRQLG